MLETERSSVLSFSTTPTEFDPYECKLSAAVKKVANDELREDENMRTQALAQFREWISKHTHIKRCRTDAVFLLRFLRTKKFSVPAACEMLERYLTIRQLYPEWFQKLDIQDKNIEEIFDAGYLVPLPVRDEFGRQIVLSRTKMLDPFKYTSADVIRLHSLVTESMLDDEESQVCGYSYIYDHSELTMSHISLWTLTDIKKIIRCIQNSTPLRYKQTLFLNLPSFANKMIDFSTSLLSDKLKKRLMMVKNEDELKAKVDPKLLPLEYGGTVPIKDMLSQFKENLYKQRQKILALDNMFIEITKDSAKLVGNDDCEIDGGCIGSFRKLEVD